MATLAPAVPLADLTEKDWDRQLRQLTDTLGWARYHTLRSKGSTAGYPDLTLVRERVVWIELKTERGKLTAPQKDWLRRLHTAGCEAYVARPSDLETLAVVLAVRRRYGDFPSGPDGERARIAANALHIATREEAA